MCHHSPTGGLSYSGFLELERQQRELEKQIKLEHGEKVRIQEEIRCKRENNCLEIRKLCQDNK